MPENLKGKPLYALVLAEIVREQTPYLTIPRALRQGPVSIIKLPDGAVDEEQEENGAGRRKPVAKGRRPLRDPAQEGGEGTDRDLAAIWPRTAT